MQIRLETNTKHPRARHKGPALETRKSSAQPPPFQVLMDEILPPDDVGKFDLNRMWKQLPQIEKDFIANPTQKYLEAYRSMVRSIARASLQKNIRIKKMKKHVNSKRLLSWMEIIDQRLHKMALLIQSPRIRPLAC